jgi:DNA helicase-2/ATP-dependent DNA helicase PcrA
MFIVDLHIHSYLSRATAKNLNLEHLSLWAQLKGIRILGTGDFTHPQWFSELKDRLQEAEPGLFLLRPEFSATTDPHVPPSCRAPVRFMLSAEISCIYKKNGVTRKNHNVVFLPDFESAEKLNHALGRIGNIRSDGRPILGLDAHDLLETVLNVSPHAYLIPAHIWTPWFSLFGSKSGFDALEECFGDLSHHIFAVETGLSSDPPMNWRLSALDNIALVSNSDAHSPANLGREANVFDTDLSYFSVFDSLKSRNSKRFLGTIEFFPEEGKYHYDGHRKCNMRMSPRETIKTNSLCPKCGRPVTVGVMHRVEELADREVGFRPQGAAPFRSLLTLPDILAQTRGVGTQTKWVQTQYRRLVEQYGPEFTLLMDLPFEELEAKGHNMLVEGLRRMRQGQVHISAGYDGEFGSISLFTPEERRTLSGQGSLISFGPDPSVSETPRREEPLSGGEKEQKRQTEWTDGSGVSRSSQGPAQASVKGIDPLLDGLNPQQQKAVCHWKTPLLIVAGPGTGKTLTLTRRVAYLIRHGIARPEQVLAITFTNKAAEEMQERLAVLLGRDTRVTAQTFHSLGYGILREQRRLGGDSGEMRIFDEIQAEDLLRHVLTGSGSHTRRKGRLEFLEEISRVKQNLQTPEALEASAPDLASAYRLYQEALEKAGAIDLDDLIVLPVRLLEDDPEVLDEYQGRFPFLSVDEYQDINHAQYRLIQLLSPHGENLCVIGDPDQAIYGFRGADRRYFLQFQNDYPGVETVCLEQSFRSSETILQASARLLNQNTRHLENRLWSGISGDNFLSVAEHSTDKAEAESVVHTIEQLMGGISHFSLDSGRVDVTEGPGARSFSDFAVFYRLHAQGDVLAQAFERSGIPFCRIGGEALAKHIRVRRVLHVLGEDLGKLSLPHPQMDESAPSSGAGTDGRTLGEVVKNIIESLGFDPEEEALKTLVRQAGVWTGDIAEFLARMAMRSDLDTFDPRAEKVTLMTLHASKGLEFPVVFILGCEADLLPYRPKGRPPSSEEEERRLFYVGLTRAREKIFLSHARKRTVFGQTRMPQPSPFIGEIEDYLQQVTTSLKRRPVGGNHGQLHLF